MLLISIILIYLTASKFDSMKENYHLLWPVYSYFSLGFLPIHFKKSHLHFIGIRLFVLSGAIGQANNYFVVSGLRLKFSGFFKAMLPALVMMVAAIRVGGQVAGDFQTKNTTGNWSDFNVWNVYNGATWVAATTGQLPTAATSVFVQAAHTISVDNSFAVCNDLNITNTSSGKITFSTAASGLNVKGNLTLAGTANCFGAWTSGAKIIFSGTGSQSMPDNLGTNSVLDHVEVNKSAGTLTSGNSFKFNKFTLNAGNFDVSSGAEVRGNSAAATININGGNWTQTNSTTRIYNSAVGITSPIGTVTINGGKMILATSTLAGGFQFSELNIINGGTLTLQNFSGNITIGTSINLDVTSTFNTAISNLTLPSSVTFNGVVNYNHSGAQTINASTYSYLKLSGTGPKTLGGNTSIPANGTLEISGVAASPTLDLGGNSLTVSSTNTTLIYSSAVNQIASNDEWNNNFQNVTVTINNGKSVSMAGLAKTINGVLTLNSGTLNIGAGGSLSLNGSLTSTTAFIDGTNTSELNITGTSGGTALLPVSANISFKNITIGGNRTLQMNGAANIDLNGSFTIESGATFDNGGESQITGSGSISISGKFITRDVNGFTGGGSAIPGINPILNAGCTIEYGLATGNPQVVTARSDYSNLVISGTGIKTPANSFSPHGTINITGNAIFDCTSHNIGDINTNITMDGGRLIVGTGGIQPAAAGLYNLNGGVVEFAGTTPKTIRTQTYQNIEVTGTGVGNSGGNITLNDLGIFIIKSGGDFTINDNNITGPAGMQTVTVENSATFNCGNNKGFNGFIPTLIENSSLNPSIENINLNPGSTVNYSRNNDQVITNANGIIYQNLTIGGTGNKTAQPGTLTIQGNLSKTGASTFDANGGTIVLNGSTQSFAGLTYNNLRLDNAGTKTMAGNAAILDSITIGNPGSNPATILELGNYDLTLKSSAAKTAKAGTIAPAASVSYSGTGRFIVERYYPANRSWRLITSPLSSNNTPATLFSQWQNNGTYTSGIGTFVTGPNPDSDNGLDNSFYNNYSLKKFENNAYVNVGNTKIPLSDNTLSAANIGYFMFVRGDRNRTPDNTIYPNTNATTLSSRGKLQSGTQTFPGYTRTLAGPRNFALIGNPYPSPVNFDNVTRNNLVKRFIVWDPKINQVGAFVEFDDLDNDGNYTQSKPSPGGQDKNIQSSQAFFVETDAALAPSGITFEESSKSNYNNPGMFRPAAITSSFKSSLYLVNPDNSTIMADGNLAEFHEIFNNDVDIQDALKFINVHETFSLLRNNLSIAMERRPTITGNDTLYFNLTRTTQRNYQFRFEPDNLDPLLSAILEDSYSGIKIPVSVSAPSNHNFTINSDAASAAANRFRIVFRLAESGPLPVTFSDIKAGRQGNNIVVEWVVENEFDITKYEVGKSKDGISFSKVNTTIATGANLGSTTYNWLDVEPESGDNYYRILSVGQNGKLEFSRIVKVKMNHVARCINVYPNPVTNGIIGMEFKNMEAGVYQAKLVNHIGQTIFNKIINHARGISFENIQPRYKLVSGIYQLEVTTPEKKIIMINLIIK